MSQRALSPSQFGFRQVPLAEWHAAQDAADYNRTATSRPRRISPETVIHTGQEQMFPMAVQHYQDSPRRRDPYQGVEVIQHKGKVYMGEGHHRMAAAREAGRKSIRVNWTDTGE